MASFQTRTCAVSENRDRPIKREEILFGTFQGSDKNSELFVLFMSQSKLFL